MSRFGWAAIAFLCHAPAVLATEGSLRNLQQSSDWDGPFNTKIVGAGAANLPGGKVLLWSGQQSNHWGGGGQTLTVIWDPSNNSMQQKTVTTNNHVSVVTLMQLVLTLLMMPLSEEFLLSGHNEYGRRSDHGNRGPRQ